MRVHFHRFKVIHLLLANSTSAPPLHQKQNLMLLIIFSYVKTEGKDQIHDRMLGVKRKNRNLWKHYSSILLVAP
jgi:hypothetical protein